MSPSDKPRNESRDTVESFGDEWSRFDQAELPEAEHAKIFGEYFSIFPWDDLPPDAEGFDLGCGSGRWAKAVAARVGRLNCVDASPEAIAVATRNLASAPNVAFHVASVDDMPLEDGSQDFGYSLGVLHHVPDTQAAIASCVKLLKPGAPFLLYLYYALENRSSFYSFIWRVSDLFRRIISGFPPFIKSAVTDTIAILVYFPLARTARLLEKMGIDVRDMPLSYYRTHSFYTMRTDSRDRFGTPLERRFTRREIAGMMEAAGLTGIEFSESQPFWCAVGRKIPQEARAAKLDMKAPGYVRRGRKIRALGLALYSNLAASTRHRLTQYIVPLREHGIELCVRSLLDDAYLLKRYAGRRLPYASMAGAMVRRMRELTDQESFDCAIVYCEVFPLMPSWAELRLLKIPYVYDLDDAFYLKYRSGALGALSFALGNKIDNLIRGAAAVSAGNATLLAYTQKLNANCAFFPTVVDTARYTCKPSWASSGPLNIGWIGSPSTAPYLNLIVEPLERLAREGPVRLTVIGGIPPSMRGVEIVTLDWSEAMEVEAISQFDIGVMPLYDDPWSRGKCAFKLIQYMACGLPVVASRVGANIEVVTPECGRLAGSDDEWCDHLRFFRDHPEARKTMGENGRARVQSHYSLAGQAPLLAALIEDVMVRPPLR
jgi:SAM-dependent methyltransferase